jgi:uncharacterized protein (TIGR02270 family)
VTFDLLARFDDRLSHLVYKLSERAVLAERFVRQDQAAFKSGLSFVVAIMALRGRVVGVFDELLARLDSDQELLSPLASALTWLEYKEVHPVISHLLAASSPARLRLGIVAAVAHQVDPGGALDRALDGPDAHLRACALEAIGRLALSDLRARVHGGLDGEDVSCRFWAAWSAVRFGDRSGIPVLGRFAAENGPFARVACDIALRALEVSHALRAQNRLLSAPGGERLAVIAAGIVGDPALIDWLLDAMESPSLARLAGAAFCLMTGRDLRRDDLDSQNPPRGAPPQPAASEAIETDRAEEQLRTPVGCRIAVEEAEDDLPWPDAVRLRNWWDGNRHAFTAGIRYLAGVPIRPAALSAVLRTGNQQQRAAAALELALLNADAPLLDVTGPAHRQTSGGD